MLGGFLSNLKLCKELTQVFFPVKLRILDCETETNLTPKKPWALNENWWAMN